MGNELENQRYGVGVKSPRPTWANWLIVALVVFAAALVFTLMSGFTFATGLVWLAVVVCLVGAGVSALMGIKK